METEAPYFTWRRTSGAAPDAVQACAVERIECIATRGGRSSERMTARRPPYLSPKGEGDKSMDGKRELPEDVYGFVPQRLCDMAKAGLPESCATSPIAGFSSQRRE